MPKPLENIKVLDLTRVLAGPFCTMILSDLGAEVIKVEIPEKGDDSRHFGPFKNGKSLYFLSINRGKKSISLNLKTEKGKKIFLELIKEFDIVIENYRPGTMEKLGIGYETIKQINPKIIYAAASGFGHTGPDSKKPAYDILAQAMGGLMSITGWQDSQPTRVGMSIGDITASLFTAIGILSALFQRQQTENGQKIDVSMLDSQVAILENALVRYQVTGKSPQPLGNHHPTIAPFQAFRAKDDFFIIAAGNEILWKKMCFAMDRNDLIDDERFCTNPKRTENREEMVVILSDVLRQKNASEWVEILEKAGVPCGPINNIENVLKNKQIQARNMIVDVEDKDAGTIKIAGNPIKMSSVPEEKKRKSTPEIGEHNIEIYKNLLNLTEEEISKLEIEGVI